jgi:hypothetical protein
MCKGNNKALSLFPVALTLEHRASMKRFVSFQFLRQSVGLFGRGISSSQGRYLHTEQHKQNKRTQTSMS